jgi:ATP-dependent HslUV protease ATP-binding subunit HslU
MKNNSFDLKNKLTPSEIVKELDRHIVGQLEAKKAVAVALRNRWRRLNLSPELQEEIVPKNILMIGATGVGKTEIARRLAKLCDAPFIKVEATKFTEVGYVGRDVEQIIRDLVEVSIQMTKERLKKEVQERAKVQTQERILDAIVGESATAETRQIFRNKLDNGSLKDKEIEIQVPDIASLSMPTMDVPGMPGAQMGMMNLSDMFGKALGVQKTKTKKVSVEQAFSIMFQEESEKLLDHEKMLKEAIDTVQQNGIVFIDEIDKICARTERQGADVSREGVQRDLLPLIEGTTVSTKHGSIKTDHILFITSGAFHIAKPSDLLPELQGRLPIRVELKSLAQADFIRILTEPEANLIKQYQSLLSTEGLNLTFEQDAIVEIARLSEEINKTIENIGARRLHTILEKLLDEISFEADSIKTKDIKIDREMVTAKVSELAKNQDLTKFIL